MIKILLPVILFLFTSGYAFPQLTGNTDYDNAYRCFNTGDYQRALGYYNEFLKSNPRDVMALNQRGLCYENLGQFSNAERDYTSALSVLPNFYMSYNNRGYARLKMGMPERAVDDFTQSVLFDPNSSDGYAGRLQAYIVLGKYEQALSDANTAMNVEPQKPVFLINRTFIFMNMNDTTRLYKDMDSILKINPYNFFTGVLPSYVGVTIANISKKIDYFTGMIEKMPDAPFTYFRRGLNFYLIKKFDQAVRDFNTCIKYLPETETTVKNLSLKFIENCGIYNTKN